MSILATFKKRIGDKTLVDGASTDTVATAGMEELGESINLRKFVFIMGQLALLAASLPQDC